MSENVDYDLAERIRQTEERAREKFGQPPTKEERAEQRRSKSKRLIEEGFRKWVKKEGKADEKYADASSTLRGLDYSLGDITEFLDLRMKNWEYEPYSNLGIFISALTNQIIKEDETLELKVNDYVSYIGAFHEKGTLVVKSSSSPHNEYWWNFGYGMKGGAVIIKDGPGVGYGNHMEGGELIIEGEILGGGLGDVIGGHAVIHSIADSKKFFGSDNEIGDSQSGGLIEILCDLHSGIRGLSKKQTGGELYALKDVACEEVGLEKKGGKTVLGTFMGKGGFQGMIGQQMEGGEITVEGNIGSEERKATVGFCQKGGFILAKRNAYCSLGQDTWPGARIEVVENVYGDVGCHQTAGLEVSIGGDVRGRVADKALDMNCTIKGSVYGEIGFNFGRRRVRDRKRDSKIEIFGDVHNGPIGTNMYGGCEVVVHGNAYCGIGQLCGGVVEVDGSISGEISPVVSGTVRQNGRDITRKDKVISVLQFLGAHTIGEE